MRLKLVSDGTPQGTYLLNVATGEPIRGVVALVWSLDLRGPGDAMAETAQVVVTLRGVPVELEAEASAVFVSA